MPIIRFEISLIWVFILPTGFTLIGLLIGVLIVRARRSERPRTFGLGR